MNGLYRAIWHAPQPRQAVLVRTLFPKRQHVIQRGSLGIFLDSSALTQIRHGKIATLLLPDIGTVHNVKNACDACDAGVRVARVATHCTEADVLRQHINSPARSAWRLWVF